MSKKACQIGRRNQLPLSIASGLLATAAADHHQKPRRIASGPKRPPIGKLADYRRLTGGPGQTNASAPPTTTGAARIEQLMASAEFTLQCPADLVLRAAALTRRHVNREELLEQVKSFFLYKATMVPEGLESLPNAWLVALPKILWCMRKPHWTRLPYFICGLAVENGTLLLQFAQEQPETGNKVTAWDKIRVEVNAGLYPSRWRMLNRWHKVKLGEARH